MPLHLKGYTIEVVDDRTVSCYIPSKAGQGFIVHFRDSNKDEHVGKSVFVHADGRCLGRAGYPAGVAGKFSHQIDDSAGIKRAFRFSKVELVQDGIGHDSYDPTKTGTGLVEVRILRSILEAGPASKPVRKVHEADDGLRVPEKSKLVGFNHVALGKHEPHIPVQHKVHYRTTDTLERPYVAFHFRHRSAELLQAMNVMPRPKLLGMHDPRSPVASKSARSSEEFNDRDKKRRKVTKEAPRRRTTRKQPRSLSLKDSQDVKPIIEPDEGDDDEQRRVLEATLRDIQSSLHLIQSQLSSLSQGHRRKSSIKPERAPSPVQVGGSGDVIDLTAD
ncbi:hypothetical protein OF83DRAFT_1176771 [Amylostereum chailletii]|nr:hypothetical protein OF83DRAFT_1176771 [Amylostereum chailletii]